MFIDELLFLSNYKEESSDVHAPSNVFAGATQSYELHAGATDTTAVFAEAVESSYVFARTAESSDLPVLTITSMFFPSPVYNAFPAPLFYPVSVNVPVSVPDLVTELVPDVVPISVSGSVSPSACYLDLDSVTAVAPVLVSVETVSVSDQEGVIVTVSDPKWLIIPAFTPVSVSNSLQVSDPVLISDSEGATISVSD